MGPHYRQSLDILSEVVPFEQLEFKTGEKILDWTVPEEWEPLSAYLVDPNGIRRADFSTNNLHLLGYSMPFEGRLKKSELQKHVYTLPNQPEAIPYVTSYYTKRWGLCLSQREWNAMPENGDYFVQIQSRFTPGKLVVGEAILPGETSEEILFSSYLCHPSMANNELSGPLVLSFLYDRMKQWKHRRYTYRFVVLPETIGSVAYLSRRGEHFRDRLRAGYVLTCIGDGGNLTYKMSRRENTLADRAALHVLGATEALKTVRFNPAVGSDERQYCSPGFNLPVGSVMRTMYTDFPEYHTSLDNKSFMDFEKMSETTALLEQVALALEQNRSWENLLPYGEPQLGPRGIFRTVSEKQREDHEIALWWVLNYSDGEHDLLAIAERSGCTLRSLNSAAELLAKHGILKIRENGRG